MLLSAFLHLLFHWLTACSLKSTVQLSTWTAQLALPRRNARRSAPAGEPYVAVVAAVAAEAAVIKKGDGSVEGW